MRISGLQKMGLLDYPGKVACTVFTGGCNLRCPFCHNSELLANPPALMETDELLAFLDKRRGLLDGVCITGGEPCVHADLPELMAEIRKMGYAVKLDTNGSFPDLLGRILDARLADYVAVDVKNSPELYAQTVGLAAYDMAPLEESLRRLMSSGTDYELRTTVVLPFHTAASFEGIRDWLLKLTRAAGRRVPRYFLQPFVDRETVVFGGLSAPDRASLEAWCELLKPAAESVAIRGE